MSELISKPKRILIVEDDMIISLVIEKMIIELGHNVIGKAISGTDALEMALELKPDIILMDIRLKGDMSGIETTTLIKKQIDTAVIYLTGNSDSKNYELAKETDFIDLISKPFTLADLSKSINRV